MIYQPEISECLNRKLVDVDLLRYQPEVGIVYGNLGKCGCTTMKSAIWKRYDQISGHTTFPRNLKTIHQRKKDPFVNSLFERDTYDYAAFRDASFVTMVRNPFSRALSAYLDKVGNENDRWVWTPIRNRFGIREGVGQEELSFLDFLRIISTERPQYLDHHLMPLWIASAVRHVPYEKIFSLEQANEMVDYFAKKEIEVEYIAPHSTNAKERMHSYYCDESLDLVRKIYGIDFKTFAYDPNGIDQLEPVADMVIDKKSPDIRDWIDQGTSVLDRNMMGSDNKLFFQFSETKYGKERKKKIELAYAGGMESDDWKRVKAYAHFLLNKGETKKSEEVAKRLSKLMNSHLSLVDNRAAFITE